MISSKRAQQFQNLLDSRHPGLVVQELPDSTRTADEAAAAMGCTKAQIVKSLVFRRADTDEPVVVLASGVNRVDEDEIARAVGIRLAKADAQFVKAKTGYSIGGVPPIGHNETPFLIVDQDLLAYDAVWAAAGTPHAVFEIRAPITAILSEYHADYHVIPIC